MCIMRTTVDLSDDVLAAVDRLRHERSIGLSEAVNTLARAGMARPEPRQPFRQTTSDMGPGIDVTNIADALETLDGLASP
jgi:hypothetical protein